MRKYEESNLQKQCVAWFRAQYPQYAMLLIHVANEGNGNRVSGAIHKAEGVVKGVSDLIFFMPADNYRKAIGEQGIEWIITYKGLCIEMKTPKGSQSQEQKDFQKMVEAAGYKYIVVRNFEAFQDEIKDYIGHVHNWRLETVSETYHNILKASEEREREKFYKVLGKGANDGKKTK